jgi:hypothetical protein
MLLANPMIITLPIGASTSNSPFTLIVICNYKLYVLTLQLGVVVILTVLAPSFLYDLA